jgi:HAE1 family hydrophobic/amphiphilic exporter-1
MQWLADLCVQRPVFASVLVLWLVVVGAFAYFHLGVDLYPRVEFPVVAVVTTQLGTAPEEIESDITEKIERAVSTVSGIDELRSISTEGVSRVVVRFVLEKNIEVAAQEVRDRISQILGTLPKDVDPPLIIKSDPDAIPVISLALAAERPVRDVSELADKVVRRELEALSGVGDVQIVGGRLRQINLWLDPGRLQAYNLTAVDVTRAVGNQNLQLPAGTLTQGSRERVVRMQGRVGRVDELGELVVATRGGASVRVAEVGVVEDGSGDFESVAYLDEHPAVVLSVRKQSGTNTIEVARAIKQRARDLQSRLPAGYTLRVVQDSSTYIEAAVATVQEHLVVGALLASVVVLLFLRNWRSTIIAAIAIPASLISTFALMWLMDFSLNTLTLLALTLAVGIVIDDAVVVLENIYRTMEERGLPPVQAALEGTREIALAVLATTLSLVAVFVPVAFMGGLTGRFMYSFGLTMGFAILVSLVIAFSLTPMLSSRWLKVARGRHGGRAAGFFGRIDRGYARLLGWSLAHRWVIVLASLVSLVTIGPLFKHVGKEFVPKNDESQFQVNFRAPEGTALAETELVSLRLTREIRQLPGVAYTVILAGDDANNAGKVVVRLLPLDARALSQFELMTRVRTQILPRFDAAGLRSTVAPVSSLTGGGGGDADVAYVVGGPDLDKLGEYAERLMAALRKVPGVVDVDNTLFRGKPELAVDLDRAKAADLGVQVADVATTLRIMVGGQKVSTYDEGGEEYEVRARALAAWRTGGEGLSQITVPSTKLGAVRLSSVARFRDSEGPARIDRLNRRRQVTVTGDLRHGFSQQAAVDALQAEAQRMQLAPGYSAGPTGTSQEMANAARGFLIAFSLSLLFMYFVLAAQFESWLYPALILLALPLTIPFALFAIVLFQQSLNIFTALGLLVLFGVVKKNAILQIDHANHLRGSGLPIMEAIMQADRDRLRPILMTTLAFVAGAVPLLLSRGSGSGANRAIGAVIVGGQSLSLLLTLLAIPVVYSLVEQAREEWQPRQWLARVRGRAAATPAPASVRAPAPAAARAPAPTADRA